VLENRPNFVQKSLRFYPKTHSKFHQEQNLMLLILILIIQFSAY